MSFESILKDLKNKAYKPIYLFYGEESYFIDELSDYISENVLSETEKSFNQTVVYGKETQVGTIIETARRFPMMSNLQVIIVKEAQDIKNFKDFEPYANNPLSSTILVFCFKNTRSIDKRLKVFSLIVKNGEVFESKKLYEKDLFPWVKNKIESQNFTIHPDAIRLLCESVGADLSLLNNEIQKLIIGQKNDVQIQKEDVAKKIGVNRNFNIFELQKAVGAKDIKRIYQILDYFSKDPRSNPLVLTIQTLFGYFSKIIIYHSLTDKSQGNVASELGVNIYFVDEYRVAASNYPLIKLINIVGYLREYDLKAKGVNSNGISDANLAKELFYKILH